MKRGTRIACWFAAACLAVLLWLPADASAQSIRFYTGTTYYPYGSYYSPYGSYYGYSTPGYYYSTPGYYYSTPGYYRPGFYGRIAPGRTLMIAPAVVAPGNYYVPPSYQYAPGYYGY